MDPGLLTTTVIGARLGNLTHMGGIGTATLGCSLRTGFVEPRGELSVPNIGPMELIVVLVIVLLIFGPKRLPGLGKQLGTGLREFKDSIGGKDRDDDDEEDARADRRKVESALGRPEGEQAPLEGEVVRERTPR
jgi:sec-independent protein translocase protein TatA